MLMAPSWRGETRTPAVELSMRYLPNSVGGSGAGLKTSAIFTTTVEWFLVDVLVLAT